MSTQRVATVESKLAIVDVTDNVSIGQPRLVGLIAIDKVRGNGWVGLTPAEARRIATALLRAARLTEDGAA